MGAMRPLLLVVTGRPGAGKSTLSVPLGVALDRLVLSRDRVKVEMASGGAVPDNATATREFFDRLGALLVQGISCVADAAFQHAVWQPHLAVLEPLADVRVVVCDVPLAVARERRLARIAMDPGWLALHPDPVLEAASTTGDWPIDEPYVAPSLGYPMLTLDTTRPVETSLADVLSWLESRD